MSETRSPSSSAYFIPCHLGSAVFGYDGMGAIDFALSDLIKSGIPDAHNPRLNYADATVVETSTSPQIIMRYAVREFDFYYDYSFNVLMASFGVFSDVQPLIESSIKNLRPVTCHFGKRNRDYMFANLRYSRCKWGTVLSQTLFHRTRNLHNLADKIDHGLLPQDTPMPIIASDVRITNFREMTNERQAYRVNYYPQRLALSFEPVEMFNYSIANTYLSQRLYDAIRNRKRPKSRVCRIVGTLPLADVVFNVPPDPAV